MYTAKCKKCGFRSICFHKQTKYFVCDVCNGSKLRQAKKEQEEMRKEISQARREGRL